VRVNVHSSRLCVWEISILTSPLQRRRLGQGIGVSLPLLPDRLAAQRHQDIPETVLPGLLEGVPVALRQWLRFPHDGAIAH
jgi:hypothetical protein